MEKSNIITKIAFALIALSFVILISKIVPKNQFEPYNLALDSVWEKKNDEQNYWININNSQKFEKIRHHNINIAGHSIEFHQGKKIQQVHIFEYGEKFIGNYLKLADIDSNSTQELIFVSAQNYVAYLNIFLYNTDKNKLIPIERVRIDTIKKFNNEMDAINNFIVTAGADIFLDLQGSYSVQPRNIYKYNFKNKELIKNRLNSLVSPQVQHFNYQNNNYLLATFVKSTGNTISPADARMLRTSKDKDTLAMYEKYKHLEYIYGDFSSYILLYNDSLKFAFEPIEFFAWTNFTKSVTVDIQNIPHIVAFTNAQMNEPDNQKCKLVTVCNLQGKIIKQIPLPHNYTDIFSVNEKVIFYGEKTLFITDANLNPINKIENITHAHGFTDIDNDKNQEFIAFTDNTLTIYSSDFERNATLKIEQEYTPYPEEYSFSTLQSDNKNSFIFNSHLFYYQFSYAKNNFAFLKYPFFIIVFLAAFGILFLVFHINLKRLEKENLKLEQTINDRTKEIANQKEEIQAQADELETKNKNLLELGKFKKLMTNTIIHDLKNPLNYIIGNTADKGIKQAGYNMLNIILNILDINKAQAAKLNVVIENCTITEIIENAVSQVEFLLDQKNISIEKIIEHNYNIKADNNLTVRILVNMLTNAIKFSPANNKITIQVEEQNEALKIDIIDYGKGISEENIKNLFKEYTQIEAKNSGKIQSTGLGLTFCKIAAEAQNAKIKVCSIPAVKTTFSIIFNIFAVSEKIENIEVEKRNIIILSDHEKQLLQPICLKLREIKIYQASEIMQLLNTIENSSNNIELWKQKLKIAMFTANNKLYNKLITNEL